MPGDTMYGDFRGSARQGNGYFAAQKASNQKEQDRLLKEIERIRNDVSLTKEEREKNLKAAEKQLKATENQSKSIDRQEKALNGLSNSIGKLQSTMESTMKNFLTTQERIAYNLNGTGIKFSDIADDLNRAIAGTGIVKQEKVYENLSKLISQGIVNNAEQRAYLETLSQDLDMVFNYQTGSLNRLIRLQQADLSSHRMAIEASLKEFLNQNYQTSEYIKEGFANVSANLLEAQSLMSAEGAVGLEAVIQKWMGAFSSAGVSSSAVGNLSQALGYLGSGNISALSGNSMQNLLVMGAARSGLSYGNILNTGLTAEVANTLLAGIADYIASMGSGASNVVKSEYARIFGLSGVSDIVAAGQMNASGVTGIGIGSDISELMSRIGGKDGYVNQVLQVENALSNFIYGAATDVASNPLNYAIYRALGVGNDIASTLGLDMIGKGFGLAQLASLAPGFLEVSNFALQNLGMGTLTTRANGTPRGTIQIGDMLFYNPGMSAVESDRFWGTEKSPYYVGKVSDYSSTNPEWFNPGNQAMQIFDALGARGFTGIRSNFTGSIFGFENTRGISTSGSGYINDSLGSTTQASNVSTTVTPDAVRAKSLDDVYNLLSDAVNAIVDLPNQPFGTITRIAEAGNTVTIGNDLTYLQDIMTMMAMNVQNIYSLLAARFSGQGEARLVDTSSMNWNHPFDWAQTMIGGNA